MKNLILFFLILFILSCNDSKETSSGDIEEYPQTSIGFGDDADINYPAEGFDIEGSNPMAIIIADRVMSAMGGRAAWDRTRYIAWNFFGSRKLLWDKQTGNVRIESLKSNDKYLVNINDLSGKVFKDGEEQFDSDTLSKYLNIAKRIWINDSYWLVMPFKLKDSGVTLAYEKDDTTSNGEYCDVIRLSFSNVGVTPNNSYLVWVSSNDNLVKQWAYYRNFSDNDPVWVLPWDNYQKMGEILLADERGEKDLTEIKVLEIVPENIFTSFDISLD